MRAGFFGVSKGWEVFKWNMFENETSTFKTLKQRGKQNSWNFKN
jgi:hypothetical protein